MMRRTSACGWRRRALGVLAWVVMPWVVVAQTLPVAAESARPRLRHDLFSRPRLGEAPAVALPANSLVRAGALAATPALAPASQAPAAPAWRPPLRAVVMAGARSMALVDRAVVELGESVDGYRLDAVSEDSAVFIKGRERVVLFIGKVRDLE